VTDMARCRPGDLAVVISAYNRSNVGRIVTVLRLQDERDELRIENSASPVWIVRDAGGRPMRWCCPKTGKRWRRVRGPARDSQLQPIRGEKPRAHDTAAPRTLTGASAG